LLVILLAVLVSAGAGYLLSSQRTPVYSATAFVLLVDPAAQGGGLRGDELERWVSLRAQDIGSAATLQAAAESLGVGTTAQELEDAVKVTSDTEGLTVSVTASGPSPEAAVARADAVTEAYVKQEEARIAVAVNQAAETFRARLDEINKQIADASASLAADPTDRYASTILASSLDWRLRLETSAIDAQLEAQKGATTWRATQAAVTPPSPISPRPLQDAAVTGLVTGLLAAGALLQYGSRRSRRVQSGRDAAHLLGVPLLADVESADLAPDRTTQESDSALGFAAATTMLDLGTAGGVLLVTGLHDAAETRLVADEIALAAERSGWWDVVVADCVVPEDDGADPARAEASEAAGPAFRSVTMVGWSAGLLATGMRALRADSRLVVVKGPAIGRRGELAAAVLASDRVLVVVRQGSKREAVSAAGEVLRLLKASVLGIVFVHGDPAPASRGDAPNAA
jgi:capsular polysaccharide biosynthesis protein